MPASGQTEMLQMPSARQRLLDAAEEHFYGRGIHATGIDRLIHAAGVAKMSLYNNFDSKDELILAYLEKQRDDWDRRLEAHIRAATSTAERLLASFDAYLAYAVQPGFRGCRFVNAAIELPRDHPGRELVRRHKQQTRNRLTELASSAGIANPEQLGDHLFLLLEGGEVTAGILGDTEPLETARQLAASYIERTLEDST